MIGFYFLVYFLILHFVADFLLQSRKMGQRKSNSIRWLLKHGLVHLVVFWVGFVAIMSLAAYVDFGIEKMLPITISFIFMGFILSLCNAVIHMAVDGIIWNLYKYSVVKRKRDIPRDELKKKFKYWEDPWFYHTIGIDQLLHIATIAFIYQAVLFNV